MAVWVECMNDDSELKKGQEDIQCQHSSFIIEMYQVGRQV